nr:MULTISPECIES: SDR family NAD(P)-dependent oxidoreductase [Bradyrhizobium]
MERPSRFVVLSDRSGAAALATSFVTELKARYRNPDFDILVNNTGLNNGRRFEDVTEHRFDLLLQINLKSPFFLIRAPLAHFREPAASSASRRWEPALPTDDGGLRAGEGWTRGFATAAGCSSRRTADHGEFGEAGHAGFRPPGEAVLHQKRHPVI